MRTQNCRASPHLPSARSRKSKSKSKSPPVHQEDIRTIPKPTQKPTHPLDPPQTNTDQLLTLVHKIAAKSLPENVSQPGLSELLRALDLVTKTAEYQQNLPFNLSENLTSQVYRLLIQTERQKAYDSVISIQNEIYSLQVQQDSLESADADRPRTRNPSQDYNKADFTFAESTHVPSSARQTIPNAFSRKQSSAHIQSQETFYHAYVENAQPPKWLPLPALEFGQHQSLQNSFYVNSDRTLNPDSCFQSFHSGSIKLKQHQPITLAPIVIKTLKPPLMPNQQSTTQLTSQDTEATPEDDKKNQHSSIGSKDGIRHFLYNSSLADKLLQSGQSKQSKSSKDKKSANSSVGLQHEKGLTHLRELVGSKRDTPREDPALSTFERLEGLITLKQNKQFKSRCQKLVRINRERRVPSTVSFADMPVPEGDKNAKHWANADIQSMFDIKRTLSLPKITLTQESDESSSSAETLNSRRSRSHPNRAVDSNKAIVTAFYVKNLLAKGLRSLHNYRTEQDSKRFFIKATKEQLALKSKQLCFRAFQAYRDAHRGHAYHKRIASHIYYRALALQILARWHSTTLLQIRENDAKERLRLSAKGRLWKNWRAVILEVKMMRMQNKACKRIATQRVITKAFYALMSFARHSVKTRLIEMKGQSGDVRRLIFKAFKSWQKYHLTKQNKVQIAQIADQLYVVTLQRQAFSSMKEFHENQEHKREMRLCAKALREIQLKKAAIVMLKTNYSLKQTKRHQIYQVQQLYASKLKQKLIRTLHATNIEFIERAVLAEDFMERRKKRVILYLLKAYVRYNAGSFASMSPPQAYYTWLWLSRSKHPLDFGTLKFQRRLSKKYQRQQGRANSLLKTYFQQKVFEVWKRQCHLVQKTKTKFRRNLISRAFNSWCAKASTKQRLYKKQRSIRAIKDAKTKLVVFRSLLQHAKRQKTLKLAAKRVKKLAMKGCKSRHFFGWLNLHGMTEKETQLDTLGVTTRKQLVFKTYLARWRTKYLRVMKKRDLGKRLKVFQARAFKHKFLMKWLSRLQRYAELTQADVQIVRSQRKRMLQIVFSAFKKLHEMQMQKKELYAVLAGKNNRNLLTRAVDAWRIKVPELKKKRILILAVRNDFLNKLRQKAFDALRQRRDYTIERGITDAYMTKAVQTIALKKFFKRWECLFSRRLGLQYFADTIQKIKMKSAFKRGRNLMHRYAEIREHMELYRHFKLLQCSLYALHRHAHRKDYLIDQAHQCITLRYRSLLNRALSALHTHTQTQKHMLKFASFALITLKHSFLQRFFEALKKCRTNVVKIRQHRRKYFDDFLQKVFYNLRNEVYKRKVNQFVRHQNLRNQCRRVVQKWRAITLAQAEEDALRIQAFQMGKILIAVTRWRKYAVWAKHWRVKVAEVREVKRVQMIRATFGFWRQTATTHKLARLRQDGILAYVAQKQKLKAFTSLLLATQTSKHTRRNKTIASEHFKVNALRKALLFFHVRATQKRCHRQCVYYISKRRLLPKVLTAWKTFTVESKNERRLKLKALHHLGVNLSNKAFASLRANVQLRKTQANLRQQLRLHYEGKVIVRALNSWQLGVKLSKETKQKRERMRVTVQKVDKKVLLRDTFVNWRKAKEDAKMEDQRRVEIAREQRRSKLFASWKQLLINRKVLTQLKQKTQEAAQLRILRRKFSFWHSSASKYQQSKLMAARRIHQVLVQTFRSLRLSVHMRKANKFASLWRQDLVKKQCFSFFKQNVIRSKYHKGCVSSMQQVLGQRLIQKALLSLKYFVLTQKGCKLLRAKIDQKSIIKAFDALRYETISNRITKEFILMKQAELKQRALLLWVGRLHQVRLQREKLGPLVLKSRRRNLKHAVSRWRRSSFGAKFFEKLIEHLVLPVHVSTAIECFREWQRYVRVKRATQGVMRQVRSAVDDNLVRSCFSHWLRQAIKQAPVSIFCSKMERLNIIIGARAGFQAIVANSNLRVMQETAVGQMIEEREHRMVARTWTVWRRRFLMKKKALALKCYHDENTLVMYLGAWQQAFFKRAQESRHQKIENEALMQAYAYYGSVLVKHCFTKLVFNLLRQRQNKQAVQFRTSNLALAAFQQLYVYSKRRPGSLMRKQQAFVLYRQQKVAKLTLDAWINAYQQMRLVQAIRIKRERNVKAVFMRKLAEDVCQSRKVSRIGKHAEVYFTKRRNNQSLFACFNALKSEFETRVDTKRKFTTMERRADKHRSRQVLGSIFNQWREQAGKSEKARSKLYTLFSGWKFYTKERVLLKKYLFECGESIGDLSMMTTSEMRDSVRHLAANHSISFDRSIFDRNRSMETNSIVHEYHNTSASQEPVMRIEDQPNQLTEVHSSSSLLGRRFSRLQAPPHNTLSQKSLLQSETNPGQQLTSPMILHKSLGQKHQINQN